MATPIFLAHRRRGRRRASAGNFENGQRRYGATVMESPVWMPIGSMFSIEHMTTKRSRPSGITESAVPSSRAPDSSTSTGPRGFPASAMAQTTFASNSSRVVDEDRRPTPPRAERGAQDQRRKPEQSERRLARASASDVAGSPCAARSRPILRIARLEVVAYPRPCRSAWPLHAPDQLDRIFHLSRIAGAPPSSARLRLSAVCPPSVGRMRVEGALGCHASSVEELRRCSAARRTCGRPGLGVGQ